MILCHDDQSKKIQPSQSSSTYYPSASEKKTDKQLSGEKGVRTPERCRFCKPQKRTIAHEPRWQLSARLSIECVRYELIDWSVANPTQTTITVLQYGTDNITGKTKNGTYANQITPRLRNTRRGTPEIWNGKMCTAVLLQIWDEPQKTKQKCDNAPYQRYEWLHHIRRETSYIRLTRDESPENAASLLLRDDGSSQFEKLRFTLPCAFSPSLSSWVPLASRTHRTYRWPSSFCILYS